MSIIDIDPDYYDYLDCNCPDEHFWNEEVSEIGLGREFVKDGVIDVAPEDTVIRARLSTLTSGFIYQAKHVAPPAKMETLAEMSAYEKALAKTYPVLLFEDRLKLFTDTLAMVATDHPGANVVVTYYYKFERELLLGLLPNALTDKHVGFVGKWNTGEFPHLLLQYGSSSKSINLQHGGSIMVAFSRTDKYEDTYQIIRRIARQGQKHDVHVYELHLEATRDAVKERNYDKKHASLCDFKALITIPL